MTPERFDEIKREFDEAKKLCGQSGYPPCELGGWAHLYAHELVQAQGAVAQGIVEVAVELLDGIRKWAQDEDGIPYELADAYFRARGIVKPAAAIVDPIERDVERSPEDEHDGT